MSMFRHIIAAGSLVLGFTALAQHSPLTSQYLFNGLLINPAYAGSRDALTASLMHRQQWVGFEGAPVTQVLSVHSPLNKRKVGLGLTIYSDKIGVSRETGVFSSYAYRMRLGAGRLSLGLGAGLSVLRSNWQDVAIQDPQDLSFSANATGQIKPDFSAGAYYYTDRYFLGFSMPFLVSRYGTTNGDMQPMGQTPANLQPMLTGGYIFTLSPDLKLKPSTLIRYRAESGPQADLSANLIFRDLLWAGLSYRTGDAVVGTIEVLPVPNWRLGYAYDMGISSIRPYHAGTHELMLQYEFGYRLRMRDPRYF